MDTSQFLCLACRQHRLSRDTGALVCPACGASFPINEGIPILLPSPEQRSVTHDAASQNVSLSRVRAVYDRAYQRNGLMGTDLDKTYNYETKRFLLDSAGPLTGKTVLDVGTGIGNLWQYVSGDVAGFALDPSLVGASKAGQRFPWLTVSVSIAEHLPYEDEFFDVVLAADTLEHTFSPVDALSDIWRVLRPGGAFSLSLPIPNSLRKWGWNQFAHERFDPGLFIGLAKVVFLRLLLFGRPDFQPIDRDYDLDHWKGLLQDSGFQIEQAVAWPPAPRVPIVYLVHTTKLPQ